LKKLPRWPTLHVRAQLANNDPIFASFVSNRYFFIAPFRRGRFTVSSEEAGKLCISCWPAYRGDAASIWTLSGFLNARFSHFDSAIDD